MSNSRNSPRAIAVPAYPERPSGLLDRASAAFLTRVTLKLLILSTLFFSCTRTLIDLDLYRHLKIGIDICQNGNILQKDTYSFLSFDQPWINHEWLADVVLGYIYLHFGWIALVLFKAVVVALMLLFVYKAVDTLGCDDFEKSLLVLMAAVFASPATSCIRPHVFSCLFLAILFVAQRSAKSGKPKMLWFLPPMFAIWVNFHGGFVVGLATLAAWIALESLVELRRRKGKRHSLSLYWLTFVLSCAATLVNPYGYELPLFTLQIAVMPRPYNLEWQPIQLLSGMGLLWAAMVAVTIFALMLSKKSKDVSSTVLWLIFALTPLVAIRHFQFFGIATALLVGEHYASAWNQLKSQTQEKFRRSLSTPDVIFLAVCLPLSVWLIAHSIEELPRQRIIPGVVQPDHAVALLKLANARGNMLLDYDWGSYVTWNLAPQVKVSIDGRDECVYSPAVRVASHVMFDNGTDPWDFLLEKFPVDMVLVKTISPTYSLMKLKPGWKLVYRDEFSALFLPAASRQTAIIENLLRSLPERAKLETLTVPLL